MAELAMARLAALTPGLRGVALFTATGDQMAAHGEQLTRESAGRKFWKEAAERGDGLPLLRHFPIPGGEFFGARVEDLVMLALADPGALPSLTLMDMQTILETLAADGRAAAGRKR